MTLSRSQVKFLRGASGIVGAMLAWEILSRSGTFPSGFSPPLGTLAVAAWHMLLQGDIFIHIFYTLMRVIGGMALAFVIAMPIGIAMARSQRFERFFIYPLSALMPIPSLAWVPLLVIWVGLGNMTTLLIVTYASVFPMIYNMWTGTRAINPIWLRSAAGMNADRHQTFWKVVIPASFPYMITGVRLSFGRAWMAVIGAELLAATDWGLGRLVFEAKEWLTIDVMLNALVVIGLLGLLFEKAIFQTIDRVTVQRWGIVKEDD